MRLMLRSEFMQAIVAGLKADAQASRFERLDFSDRLKLVRLGMAAESFTARDFCGCPLTQIEVTNEVGDVLDDQKNASYGEAFFAEFDQEVDAILCGRFYAGPVMVVA